MQHLTPGVSVVVAVVGDVAHGVPPVVVADVTSRVVVVCRGVVVMPVVVVGVDVVVVAPVVVVGLAVVVHGGAEVTVSERQSAQIPLITPPEKPNPQRIQNCSAPVNEVVVTVVGDVAHGVPPVVVAAVGVTSRVVVVGRVVVCRGVVVAPVVVVTPVVVVGGAVVVVTGLEVVVAAVVVDTEA
jgi:hypothetical protein